MIDLDAVRHLKVLYMGDAIVDKYTYVHCIGKAIKENALSSLVQHSESWPGGVAAAARHTRNFCKQVDVWHGENAMLNTRLVDRTYLRKLFVTHELVALEEDDLPPLHPLEGYDMVVVTDFGHGTMTPERIEMVTRRAKYLAVNVQTNATNFGFNVIKKYPRADFVVLDELEARLAAHDNTSTLERVVERLGYTNIIITRGVMGALGFDGAFHEAPAVAQKIVDSMGAGDAFLAVTAPFACVGEKMPNLLKIGNAAGAAKVEIIGHERSVSREQLEKYLLVRDIHYSEK